MYLEAMRHFFRWHLPIERICIIYFPLGKLPGEYPDRIIVLPSSNRSKHEAILLSLPSLPILIFPPLSFPFCSPCLSFLTNFGSARIDFFEISSTFDLLIVIYISLWKNDSTFNQMVDFFPFLGSTRNFSLDLFFLLLLLFFIFYYYCCCFFSSFPFRRIHASETVLTLISSVTTSLTYILVRNQFVTFRFLTDFHDNGSCETI